MSRDGYLPPGCTQQECDEAQPGYWDEPDEPCPECGSPDCGACDCEAGPDCGCTCGGEDTRVEVSGCNYPNCDGGPATGYCHTDCRGAS